MKAKVTISAHEVKYLMLAGNDVVESTMLSGNARRLIDEAESVKTSSRFPEFPVCVNEKFFFPAEFKKLCHA